MPTRFAQNFSQKTLPRSWERMLILAALLCLLLIPQAALALKMISGDHVVISEPVADDIFGSAGVIEINAPVEGAIITGGSVFINAPVYGNILVAAGDITVNSEIHGNLIGGGGTVGIHRGVEKNVILAGVQAKVYPNTTIWRDMVFAGGSLKNEGRIAGNLTLYGGELDNTGYIGRASQKRNPILARLETVTKIANATLMVGFLIIGIFILFIFPDLYKRAEEQIRKRPVRTTVSGFLTMFASPLVVLVFVLSIVGIPLAFVIAVSVLVSLMAAVIFVSYTIGHYFFELHGLRVGSFWGFALGMLVLNLLFRLPYLGTLAVILTLGLGSGAVYYVLKRDLTRKSIWARLRDLFGLRSR
ncbi:MAG: hypothetical protein ACP5E4_01025 [Candidatus Aenigmatarchaeota archaeon]